MKKYLQIFRQSFIRIFEYRGEIVSAIAMRLVGIGAVYFLWSKLVKDYISVGDYDLNSIMTYYLLSGLLISLFTDKMTKHFERWIQEGDLAQILIKPLKPAAFLFLKELGIRLSIVIINTAIFMGPIILIPAIRNSLYINLTSIAWVLIFLILSNIFFYFFFWTLGSLAFWLINLDGVRNVTSNLLRILKGDVFPLDLAPQGFQNIMSSLPFQYALFYPVKILTSPLPLEQHLKGITVLTISIILFIATSLFIWRRGLKRFDSVGI